MAQIVEGFRIRFDGVDEILSSYDEINEAHKRELKALRAIRDTGSDAYREQQKIVAQLAAEKKRLNRQNREAEQEYKAVSQTVGAYERLSNQLAVARRKMKDLAAAGETATDEFQALAEEVTELDTRIKEIDASAGQFQRNVGNYPNPFADMAFGLIEFDEATGKATIGAANFGKALKVLAANPFIAAAMALTAALFALFDAFKGTEKGAVATQRAMAYLDVAMANLGLLASNIYTAIESLFTDPRQAIKDFGKLLQDYVINYVQQIIQGFGKLATAGGQLFRGEFKKAAETAAAAYEDFADALLGSDGAAKKLTGALAAQKAAFDSLRLAKLANAKANKILATSLEEFITAEAIAAQAAGDSTLPLKEQEAAAEAARIALEEKARLQVKIAQNNLKLIREEIALNEQFKMDVTGLRDQELAAFQELKGAQRDYTLAVKQNETDRRQIARDRVERDLDFLIDIFDKQKSINERIIGDESRSIISRQKLLSQTKKLADDTFAAQIAAVENFAGVYLDANALVSESDARVVTERVKALAVDDVIAGRLLEIINERKLALLDLAETEKSLADARAKEAVSVSAAVVVDDTIDFDAIENEFADTEQRYIDSLNKQLAERKSVAAEEVEVEKQKQDAIQKLGAQGVEVFKKLSENRLKADLEAAGSNERQIKEAQERAAKRAKAISLFEIAINTASAVVTAMRQTGTLAPFVIPSIIAQGAVQAGIVAATPIKFARGGMIEGALHSAGGVPFTVGGRAGFEAEGGEAIINRRSMANPALRALASAINEMGGGVSFARQGSAPMTPADIAPPRQTVTGDKTDALLAAIDGRFDRLRVIAKPDEILREGRRIEARKATRRIEL